MIECSQIRDAQQIDYVIYNVYKVCLQIFCACKDSKYAGSFYVAISPNICKTFSALNSLVILDRC